MQPVDNGIDKASTMHRYILSSFVDTAVSKAFRLFSPNTKANL